MEIKGTAVKSTIEFVRARFAERYNEWLEMLPTDSRAIMESPVYATDWYPIINAAILPTKAIGHLFYDDIKKGAWEVGRFSAEVSLTGIYKVFIKLTSPAHIIDRASKIMETYYRPAEIAVVERPHKGVRLHIKKLPTNDAVIEHRISGWMERALEINNCKNISINIPLSLSKGDEVTEIAITWQQV